MRAKSSSRRLRKHDTPRQLLGQFYKPHTSIPVHQVLIMGSTFAIGDSSRVGEEEHGYLATDTQDVSTMMSYASDDMVALQYSYVATLLGCAWLVEVVSV